MNKTTQMIIVLAAVVLLAIIVALTAMLMNDSQKIEVLTGENQAQTAAQAASSTQAQATLEQQQQTCDSLKVEFASECSQTEQQNENKMSQDIQNCINDGSVSANTCSQNFTNDFKGAIGIQFLVNCENQKLVANACPLLPSVQ